MFENRKIKMIIVNWFYSTELGEEYTQYMVGGSGVKSIRHHVPQNGLQRDYCEIELEDGRTINEYNVNTIEYFS